MRKHLPSRDSGTVEMSKADQIEQFLGIRGEDKAARSDIAALAREHGPKSVTVLARLMDSPKTKPMVRVAAAKELLDRGYGKATVHIDAGGKDDAELEEMAAAILLKRGIVEAKVLDAVLVEPSTRLLPAPQKSKSKVRRKKKKAAVKK